MSGNVYEQMECHKIGIEIQLHYTFHITHYKRVISSFPLPPADTAHHTPTERDRKDYYFIMDIIYLKPSSAMKHYEGTYPQIEIQVTHER